MPKVKIKIPCLNILSSSSYLQHLLVELNAAGAVGNDVVVYFDDGGGGVIVEKNDFEKNLKQLTYIENETSNIEVRASASSDGGGCGYGTPWTEPLTAASNNFFSTANNNNNNNNALLQSG